MVKYAFAAAFVLGFTGSALAAADDQFVIIKDANKHCRVVEKDVASESNLGEQVGKQAYPSSEEATIDLKVVCENP
jgi:hypothetical protein